MSPLWMLLGQDTNVRGQKNKSSQWSQSSEAEGESPSLKIPLVKAGLFPSEGSRRLQIPWLAFHSRSEQTTRTVYSSMCARKYLGKLQPHVVARPDRRGRFRFPSPALGTRARGCPVAHFSRSTSQGAFPVPFASLPNPALF